MKKNKLTEGFKVDALLVVQLVICGLALHFHRLGKNLYAMLLIGAAAVILSCLWIRILSAIKKREDGKQKGKN